jgi:hypothetical protein
MKLLHNNASIQHPRCPISPTPPEVEIPSFEDRLSGMANFKLINQYDNMFFEPD